MADESTGAGPPLRSTYWRKVWLKTTRSRALRRAPVEHRWLWIVLLLLPDDYGGRLVSDDLPLTVEEIADEAALDVKATRDGLEYFIGRGMLERNGGVYRVVNFKTYQLSPEAERKRRQRQREADLSSSSETEDRDRGRDRDSVTLPVTSHVTCHGIENDDRAEPKRLDADLPTDDPVLMIFPTGQKGVEWSLLESKALEGQTSYPWLDVLGALSSARQWCRDNPAKRKTARGMTRFLGSWLARDLNNGKHRRPREWQPGDPLEADLTPQKTIRERDIEIYMENVRYQNRKRAKEDKAKMRAGKYESDVPF